MMIRCLLVGLTALIATLSVACAPQNAAEPAQAEPQTAAHPVSGLDVVPLSVKSGDATHEFRVEVARTGAEQNRGLMFRTQLAPDEGMIFPRNPPRMASFWMKNTPLPLDIIFVGDDGRIINIAANTVPYSLDSVLSEAPAALVFEIAGGRAAELGIKPGDSVEWAE